MKSLGAAFVELELEAQEGQGGYAREQSEDFLRRQRELIGKEVAGADVVITTAAIPGRKAPVLVTAEMVDTMTRGSVIVDLAAESGGNCELSRPGEDVEVDGVTIIGVKNLPSSMPLHASFLYCAQHRRVPDPDRRNKARSTPTSTTRSSPATCVTHPARSPPRPDPRAA